MSVGLLRKVQLLHLEVLKEFRRTCDYLGIKYILDSGTLLGAVRNQGFIPWDDDVDVGLLREEYEIFLREAPRVLKEGFYLRTCENDYSWGYVYSKLCVSSSEYLDVDVDIPFNHSKITLDVFPYDVFPNDEKKRRLQKKLCGRYKKLLRRKAKYFLYTPPSNFFRRIGYDAHFFFRRCGSAFWSRSEIIKLVLRAQTLYNDEPTGLVFEEGGDRAAKYGAWVVPERCLRETVDLVFEGEKYPCPIDYDAYLKATYGDYMTLPPENQRVPKHSVVEQIFGVATT